MNENNIKKTTSTWYEKKKKNTNKNCIWPWNSEGGSLDDRLIFFMGPYILKNAIMNNW